MLSGAYDSTYPAIKGLSLSPDMTPIAMLDRLNAAGIPTLQCWFQTTQYYFGEYPKLAIACR